MNSEADARSREICKHGLDVRFCAFCLEPLRQKQPLRQRSPETSALSIEFPSSEAIILRGALASGWRVGPRTGCFVGACRFDWRGASGQAKLHIFPIPSDRSLITAPQLEGEYDRNQHLRWEFYAGMVTGRIDLIVHEGWNASLSPELSAVSTLKLYHNARSMYLSQRFVRVQVLMKLDFSNPNRDLVWWERFGTISGGLPSLGKKR